MFNGGGQWEQQRQHYNKHVKNLSTKQALQERSKGEALPLKNFHNDIKRLLIRRFAYRAGALLDLACGRGGDLHKWKDAEIRFVKGLDIADAEIAEASRRYSELRRRPGCCLDAEFVVTNQLGASDWVDDLSYDVVTCMFALHYFYVSEDALRQLLKNVSANLRDGGYFLGTLPDGKRVLYNLNDQPEFNSRMLWLRKEWQGPPAVFNCRYICAIADTVTDGHEESVGSSECLVFFNALVSIAASVGLHPVCHYGDLNLDSCFEEGDVEMPFKHFSPDFPNSDPSLETASRLNVAFVFQKRPAGERETLPPLPLQSRGGTGGGDRRQQDNAGLGQQGQAQKRRRLDEAPGGSRHLGAGHRSSTGISEPMLPGPPPNPPSVHPVQLTLSRRPHHDHATQQQLQASAVPASESAGPAWLQTDPQYVDDDDDLVLLPATTIAARKA